MPTELLSQTNNKTTKTVLELRLNKYWKNYPQSSRLPTIDLRLTIDKIRLNSDSFLAKNQTKFRLIGEEFRLRLRIGGQRYDEQKIGLKYNQMPAIAKHYL